MRARVDADVVPAPAGPAADHLGMTLSFRDGTTSRVFRETVAVGAATADPTVLVIAFRLAFLDDVEPLHTGFRHECLIHTPLFAGFPGFRSKLWLEDDDTRIYRGVYQWDGATDAAAYAGRMVGLLTPFSNPDRAVPRRAGIDPSGLPARPGSDVRRGVGRVVAARPPRGIVLAGRLPQMRELVADEKPCPRRMRRSSRCSWVVTRPAVPAVARARRSGS